MPIHSSSSRRCRRRRRRRRTVLVVVVVVAVAEIIADRLLAAFVPTSRSDPLFPVYVTPFALAPAHSVPEPLEARGPQPTPFPTTLAFLYYHSTHSPSKLSHCHLICMLSPTRT